MHSLKRHFQHLKQSAFHRLCKRKNVIIKPYASIETTRITSFEEYNQYVRSMSGEYESRFLTEQALLVDQAHFEVPGYCFVCSQPVSFLADYVYGFKNADGQIIPNWRECLVCPGCRLNNRMRAAIHLFHELCHPRPDCSLYITEQTTPLFKWLNGVFTNVIGSEFLGFDGLSGSENPKGIRHEDLTRLSYADGQFDFVLSFDVFEHIPNYKKAFSECRRVLKKGGVLFFTIPFDRYSARNIIRAEILPDGTTNHLMPPEYHGDPLQESGCLCFRHFGWECLDELKNEGFSETACYLYWSLEYGYLGGEQLLFLSKA